jgi:hypothetical protein
MLELLQNFVVLIHTDTNVTEYLAKQGTHDNLCAVIGDNDYPPFGASEGIMLPWRRFPSKPQLSATFLSSL